MSTSGIVSASGQPIPSQATSNAAAQSFRHDLAQLGDIPSEDIRGYAVIVITKTGSVTNYNAAPGAYGERLIGRLNLVTDRLEAAINLAEENVG